MKRIVLVFALLAAWLAVPPAALAQDSEAPPGAEKHWLPDEGWVNLLWLPYDEQRLYDLLGMSRGEVFRWVRIDADHTLAQLGRRKGLTADRLARALVAPRRKSVSAATHRTLVRSARRTLTQGHLAQHFLFHALHQTAIPERATRIFGPRRQLDYLRLRRAEVSPIQIGDLFGRSRVDLYRGTSRALKQAAARGIARGYLTRAQARLLLERQLRQLPRWLGQRRYNGPSGGLNRPDLPPGDVAKRPSVSADGATVTWDAYRSDVSLAERLGEIHVRGTALSGGDPFAVSPPRPSGKRPHAAYNSVLSADGRVAAFETAESTFPLAKRVGQMSIMVREIGRRGLERVSHLGRPKGAPTRTAFNPSISSDGRVVAFEATDSGRKGAASRNGLWTYDRETKAETLIAQLPASSAAFLPRMAGDGGSVAYTQSAPDGRTQLWLRRLGVRAPPPVLVSRASGAEGASADSDAYEPAPSHDGQVVAFTSRATNLGGGRSSKVFVRDLNAGTTRLVSGGIPGDAIEPSISADGRFVAFVARARFRGGSITRLRSRVWLHDRVTGRTTLVSRRGGKDGRAADGYASEPAVSGDGRVVAFTSTAGNLSRAKPRGLAGVFVRDVGAGTTHLVSEHGSGRRPTARAASAPGSFLCRL
ncbi:MAG: hypothetical protein AVDCRST_MAG85-940 [uncultured Solirubrobacteraceae bacterium]|uniref:TolB protein, periplasmic protein involved in the tonb-independent uptake of group A colicins n=1 Tax=uncultured Solirubrobacteraceae bacterium TaxID=1162706 RepID=A0A6J4S0L8_9ACTN|nr:MAG: hypothetical protein AVDCRST_MAG85-940 [uncultured Solirubrobacteraceae bacterium]